MNGVFSSSKKRYKKKKKKRQIEGVLQSYSRYTSCFHLLLILLSFQLQFLACWLAPFSLIIHCSTQEPIKQRKRLRSSH